MLDNSIATNSINVCPEKYRNVATISTKSPFFTDDFYFIQKDNCIIFKKPTIDYRGKTLKSKPQGSGWITFSIPNISLEAGRHVFDDESNDDEVIIYFN